MIATPPDPFEEFLRLPVALESDDPRFVVRRAAEADFERIYDCVDAAFGKARPRNAYDWIYKANPFGRARAWIVEEVSTGRLLKTGAFFPWPVWQGAEPLRGSLAGDSATLPEWQRKGLSSIRRKVRRSHPWYGTIATIAGPNEGSRIVMTKAGEGDSITGALGGAVAILRAGQLFQRVGAPAFLATPVGALADAALSAWQRLGLRGASKSSARFEPIGRITSDLDEVTERTMAFPMFWCPHNADFLNWRYLDHPLESYSAFALLENDRPVAYSVLRVDGQEATLAEFAAETGSPHAARLLSETLGVAREAGCAYVNFFATPSWRHWGLFRRAGMLPYRTSNYLDATYKPDEQASYQIENWQVTPGDRDFH